MEMVTGAIGSLMPKLWEILKREYKLHTTVKNQARSLALELVSAHAALRKVAEVPPDELDELVRIWVQEVREASYDMEDILDAILVRGEGGHETAEYKYNTNLFKHARENMTKLFNKTARSVIRSPVLSRISGRISRKWQSGMIDTQLTTLWTSLQHHHGLLILALLLCTKK